MLDMKSLQQKAMRLGATELGVSPLRYKRLYVIYENKIIILRLLGVQLVLYSHRHRRSIFKTMFNQSDSVKIRVQPLDGP